MTALSVVGSVLSGVAQQALGEGVGYLPESVALFARMTTQPDATRKGHINTLIKALKDAGVWSKLDLLYVLAAHDSQAARLNWIADAYNLVAVNSPVFTADQGYVGNGSTSRLNTTYIPASHGVNYTQNDASLWIWSRTSGQGAPADMGSVGTVQSRITTRNTSDVMAIRVNDGVTATASNTDGSGFFGAQRRASGDIRLWRYGSQIGTNVTTSTGRPAEEQWMLGANPGNFSTRTQSFGAWGASLTGLESAFNTAVIAYLTAIGSI